ncbi:MAG: class I SAM-dependent RNA methyltransferase [Aggregatilineales bacterium]
MPNHRKRPSRAKKQKQPSRKKSGGAFEVTLTDMNERGMALGQYKRRQVAIPYTIPGETLTARIAKRSSDKNQPDIATGVALIEASADRVYPQCPHFAPGQCRNCQWQHIEYAAQLLIKQDVLAETLSQQGQFSDETLEAAMQPFIPSAQQWEYLYQVWLYRRGDNFFGYFNDDGTSVFRPDDCPVMHPDLFALYESLDLEFDEVKRLQLLLDSDGETMILLDMKSEDAPQLEANFPTSVNLILTDNTPMNLVGNTMLHYTLHNRRFRVTAGAFFRPNIAQIENLITALLTLLDLQGTEKVLDLYAGVGIFTAFIAPHADLVTMVESYPPAATDAETNLNDAENVDIIEGSAEDVLQSLLESEEHYDAVIVNPPSSGLSKAALTALIDLAPPALLYISSDPGSLGRNGKTLIEGGYTLNRVQPIDFAPHTYYIECLALFTRT